MTQECPCGSSKTPVPVLRPLTAKALPGPKMRQALCAPATRHGLSRFDWLVESTHPDHREDVTVEQLARSAEGVHWLRLDIAATRTDVSPKTARSPDDEVDFYACYELEGVPRQLAERSAFSGKDGKRAVLWAACPCGQRGTVGPRPKGGPQRSAPAAAAKVQKNA